jgi:hypothetical protein
MPVAAVETVAVNEEPATVAVNEEPATAAPAEEAPAKPKRRKAAKAAEPEDVGEVAP